MKFPTLLALVFAAALCTGCEKGVPANIKAPGDTDQAASDTPATAPPQDDRYRDYKPVEWHRAATNRYGNEPSDDRRYSEETPSVADALSDEADEVAQRLKQRAVKGIDSLGDRFEQTIERGLKKLDDASSEAYDDSDER